MNRVPPTRVAIQPETHRAPTGRLRAAADAGRALRDRNFGEGLGALSLVGSVWADLLGRLTTDSFEQKREPVPRAR